MRKAIRTLFLVAVVVAGALVGTASPAAAAEIARCTIPWAGPSCTSTLSIPSNSQHQIRLTALRGRSSVTCAAIDAATGDWVGTISTGNLAGVSKIIPGLYGRYFVYCWGGGWGSGSVDNGL